MTVAVDGVGSRSGAGAASIGFSVGPATYTVRLSATNTVTSRWSATISGGQQCQQN